MAAQEKKVKVVCVVCGKSYLVPAESLERYAEDNKRQGEPLGYICNSCQDFEPGPAK